MPWRATGFVALSHGEAVLVGLTGLASHRLGLLSQGFGSDQKRAAWLACPLFPGVSLQQFMEALTRDKEYRRGISFMLPTWVVGKCSTTQ